LYAFFFQKFGSDKEALISGNKLAFLNNILRIGLNKHNQEVHKKGFVCEDTFEGIDIVCEDTNNGYVAC